MPRPGTSVVKVMLSALKGPPFRRISHVFIDCACIRGAGPAQARSPSPSPSPSTPQLRSIPRGPHGGSPYQRANALPFRHNALHGIPRLLQTRPAIQPHPARFRHAVYDHFPVDPGFVNRFLEFEPECNDLGLQLLGQSSVIRACDDQVAQKRDRVGLSSACALCCDFAGLPLHKTVLMDLPLFSSTLMTNRFILARRYSYSSTVPFLPAARFLELLCFVLFVCLRVSVIHAVIPMAYPVIFVDWEKAVVGATVYRVN